MGAKEEGKTNYRNGRERFLEVQSELGPAKQPPNSLSANRLPQVHHVRELREREEKALVRLRLSHTASNDAWSATEQENPHKLRLPFDLCKQKRVSAWRPAQEDCRTCCTKSTARLTAGPCASILKLRPTQVSGRKPLTGYYPWSSKALRTQNSQIGQAVSPHDGAQIQVGKNESGNPNSTGQAASMSSSSRSSIRDLQSLLHLHCADPIKAGL